jgi:hypothetical protein
MTASELQNLEVFWKISLDLLEFVLMIWTTKGYYSVSVFWFVPLFRPTGGSKGSSTLTYIVRGRVSAYKVWDLSAGEFFVRGQCPLLTPWMENSSVQVWTLSRAVGEHFYFLQYVISLFVEFERLPCGRTKEFLLLLRICSARVLMNCALCRLQNP